MGAINSPLDVVAACRWSSTGPGNLVIDAGFNVRSSAYNPATGEITLTLDVAAGPNDMAIATPKKDPAAAPVAPSPGQIMDAYVPAGPGGNTVVVRSYAASAGVYSTTPRGGQMILVRGLQAMALATTGVS